MDGASQSPRTSVSILPLIGYSLTRLRTWIGLLTESDPDNGLVLQLPQPRSTSSRSPALAPPGALSHIRRASAHLTVGSVGMASQPSNPLRRRRRVVSVSPLTSPLPRPVGESGGCLNPSWCCPSSQSTSETPPPPLPPRKQATKTIRAERGWIPSTSRSDCRTLSPKAYPPQAPPVNFFVVGKGALSFDC